MPIGAFTGSFDLPLLLVIVFTLFFGVLVFYLQQEMKREGYPLVSSRTDRTNGRVKVVGFPGMPSPKTFVLPHGQGTVSVPRPEEPLPVPADNAGNPNGMPVNTATPALGTNLGPGSWTPRRDTPELTYEGHPVYRPMRLATAYSVMKGEPDPRGYTVLGLDKQVAGTVVDIWVDVTEHNAKFLEVRLARDLMDVRGNETRAADVPAQEPQVIGAIVTDTIVEGPRGTVEIVEIDPVVAPRPASDEDPSFGSDPAPTDTIMLPMEFAAVNESNRTVRTAAITGAQFVGVPPRRFDTIITALEENRLRGFFGGGYLWAVPARTEPLV